MMSSPTQEPEDSQGAIGDLARQQETWARLYTEFWNPANEYLKQKGIDEFPAEGIAAQVFDELYDSLPDLYEVHWGWFKKRLDWRAVDFFNARRRREEHEVAMEDIRDGPDEPYTRLQWTDPSPTPDEHVEHSELCQAVRQAIGKLPSLRDQWIAELYALDYTSSEIGEIVGGNAAWVRKRLQRNIKPFLANELRQYAI